MKLTNETVTKEYIAKRHAAYVARGFPDKAKWMIFCEMMLDRGYGVKVYEARKTVSKYITVIYNEKEFKVRFSNHRPICAREINGDCDFFVGRTNLGVSTTAHAIVAVDRFFAQQTKPVELAL
jgi:hypothetical protein